MKFTYAMALLPLGLVAAVPAPAATSASKPIVSGQDQCSGTGTTASGPPKTGATYTSDGETFAVKCSSRITPGRNIISTQSATTIDGCIDLCAAYNAAGNQPQCLGVNHGKAGTAFSGQCLLVSASGNSTAGPNNSPVSSVFDSASLQQS